MAIEEPAYEVLEQRHEYEVRRYPPYLVAEVDVPGNFNEAGDNAFRILAAYIFGKNRSEEKMKMTAPVVARRGEDGERMSMTAPVLSARNGAVTGTYTYAFVMEKKYTLDTLPEPLDSRIRIRETRARTVAVRRYSGRWTEENYRKNEARLLSALAADNIGLAGQPVLARFNSPFSLWFLRRNEVQVEIDWPDDQRDRQPSLSR